VSSTLLVPVPEAEPATAPWWPQWEPPKARGVPAHVTVFFPFLRRRELTDEVLALIAEAVGGVRPFDAVFARTGRFERTLFLVPEPAAPFAELTRRLVERFPDRRPYRGEHGDVLNPHLTVLTCADAAMLERAETEVRQALPVRTHVRELWLLAEDEHGGWRRRRAFPLGLTT
jgi:hypothetical protein